MAELVVKLVNGELAGKTMQGITKEVNAAALALKKAEVGTKEWVDAHQRLEGAKQMQQDLKKQIDSTADASGQLKNAWNKLPGAQFFNKISESFNLMKSGVGGLVSQFGVLKSAIAATGIGLLVVAIATLVDWFTKTDEGATLMAGIFRALGNVTDKLFAGVRALGGAIYDAFQNPKQAILDLIELIKTNLINRVKAFGVAFEAISKIIHGDFKGGLKELADSVIQFNTGITDGTDKIMAFGKEMVAAAQAGISFEQQLDAIQDRARELAVTQADTEKTVSQLLLQSKNVGLSYKERIALLDQASILELKNHNQQLENAKALEALLQKEVDEKMKVGKVTDELDQKLKDAQIARINLDKESIDLQEKISNRRSALQDKQLAEEQKQADEELKIRQNLEDLRIAAEEEGLKKEIDKVKLDTERKIAALTGSEEQITEATLLLEQIRENEIKALKDKFAADAAEQDRKAKEEQAKRDKDAADKAKAIEKEKADFENKLANQKMDMAQNVFDQGSQLLAAEIKDQKAAKAIKKVAGVADIGFNLVKELSANAANAAANPLNAVTFGAAGEAQLAETDALSIIRAGLATAKVLAFRKGGVTGFYRAMMSSGGIPDGVLNGPSHESGGIPLIAEGQEIILTKGVYRNPELRALASAINVAGGGRKFAAGGPVNPFYDRAPIPSGNVYTMNGNNQSMDRLEKFLMENLEAINRRVDNIKVLNVMTAPDKTGYKDKIDVLNQIRGDADV